MVKRFFANCLTLWLFVIIASSASPASAEQEYALKATYMVNFARYVEWPDVKAISKLSKIDICVLGESDIINSSQIFKQASSSKLSISLVKEKNLANTVAHCHMLFISSSEESRLDEIFSTLKGKPVLTVADFDGFTERGGMVGFVLSDDRIRFIVNKNAAESVGLHVDSQLLEIALKVLDK